MANRVLLVVLSAIVLTSMAVGGLIGTQFGGDDPADGAVPVDGSASGPTATPATTPEPAATTPTTAQQTGTSEPTATPKSTRTPEPFDPASVNATAVEAHLLSIVDEQVREPAGRTTLKREATLDEMALFHSDNMGRQGFPAHDAAGYSTVERYEEFGQYTRCRVPSDSNSGVRKGEEIELVGRLTLDESDVPTNREIADRIVTAWVGDDDEKRKLLYTNADRVGVGVNVTADARVYVTVDLC